MKSEDFMVWDENADMQKVAYGLIVLAKRTKSGPRESGRNRLECESGDEMGRVKRCRGLASWNRQLGYPQVKGGLPRTPPPLFVHMEQLSRGPGGRAL